MCGTCYVQPMPGPSTTTKPILPYTPPPPPGSSSSVKRPRDTKEKEIRSSARMFQETNGRVLFDTIAPTPGLLDSITLDPELVRIAMEADAAFLLLSNK